MKYFGNWKECAKAKDNSSEHRVMRFWHLSDCGDLGTLAEWDKGMHLEQVICPDNPGHMRGGRRIGDLRVVLTGEGGAVADIVWTWSHSCLVQDRVLGLFRKAGLTGFEPRPVTARFKHSRAEKPPTLWELVVTGWAGMAPPESGVRLIEHCPTCKHCVYSGISDPLRFVNEEAWDGSDFFIVWPYPNCRFVTPRVKKLIEDEGLTGAVFVPLMSIKADGFSPGRLSYWMPEARARELGEPLGIL
jgi:hypothetical protein